MGENGYVEIEDDIGRRAEMNELMEQTSEIITFAESGGCRSWGRGMCFSDSPRSNFFSL